MPDQEGTKELDYISIMLFFISEKPNDLAIYQ